MIIKRTFDHKRPKLAMHSVANIIQVLSKHEQVRVFSCIQSAVEMVLKIERVINVTEYPEQQKAGNDLKGYEPFAGKTKKYGKTRVAFEEEKFGESGQRTLDDARIRGLQLIEEGIIPIFSFLRAKESGTGNEDLHHAYIALKDEHGELIFYTKEVIGIAPPKKYFLLELWRHQVKTEILIVRISRPKGNQ